MRQGEIRPLNTAGRNVRVLVISGDRFNLASGAPWIAPIYRLPDLPPATIALHETDPHAGAADLRELTAVLETDLGAPVGTITGHTLDRIRRAITTITGE